MIQHTIFRPIVSKVELYSTKLESIIRIKFVAEVLQGIELHAGWCVLILSTALKMNTPDIQQDEYSSTSSQWKLG